MKGIFKTIVISFFISMLLYWLEKILHSGYMYEFLKNNIITMLVTLLAINTATSTVLLAKLEDINKSYGGEIMGEAVKEIRISFAEQIGLIVTAIIVLIVDNSCLLKQYQYINDVVTVLLIMIFVYAIYILRDTGLAIYQFISKKDEKENQK